MKRKRIFLFAGLLLLSLIATLPFAHGDFRFADDWLFHFNRILGVAEGLKCGQFPVRIYPQVYYGAGYQAPLYYPDLFLYLPGFLVLCGMPLITAVYVFMFFINLGTTFAAYLSIRRMQGSSVAALVFAVAWLFCPYRLSDLYSRFALGETLALLFFPLVIAGFYDAVLKESHRPYLLAFGMSGIILSHVLSSIFALGLLLFLALCFFDRLFLKPKALLSVALSAVLSFALTAWFLISFLQADRVNTQVAVLQRDPAEAVLSFAQLLLPVTLDNNQVFFLGWCVYPAIACCIIALVKNRGFSLKNRLLISLLAAGILSALLCTALFPWNRGNVYLFSMIQFPWRFVGPASMLLFMAGALSLPEHWMSGKHLLAATGSAAVLCMLTVIPYHAAFVKDHPVVLMQGETPDSVIATEYLYYNTDPALMEGSTYQTSDPSVTVRSYQKTGTGITMELHAQAGSWLDTDLFQFTGYEVKRQDGAVLENTFGENNRLRILFDSDTDGIVTVRYAGKPLWTAATILSLLTLAGSIALIVVRAKKGSDIDKHRCAH